MLKGDIISDIELRLTRGKPSDDFETDQRQIAFWMDSIRGQLLSNWIEKYGDIPPQALTHFDCKVAISSTPTCVVGTCYTKHSITISPVLQLKEDKGVYRVALQGDKEIDRYRTSAEQDILKHIRLARPTNSHPAWYRIDDKVFLLGTLPNANVQLDLVLSSTTTVTDTDDYPLPDELINILIEEAVKKGLSQISQGVLDLTNDGKQ